MKCSNDLIDTMKKMCYENDGSVITDTEAEEAWDNLCAVFRTLLKWDKESKEKEPQDSRDD